MRRLCAHPGCKAVVDVSDTHKDTALCPIHQREPIYTPKKRYDHHYSDGKRIYGTYRWRKTSERYRDKHPFCEKCLRFDIVTPSACVDHKKELEDGGDPWDENNFEALCRSCHQKKTGQEAKKRRRKGPSLSDF